MKSHTCDPESAQRSVRVGILRIENLRIAANGILLGEIRKARPLPNRPMGIINFLAIAAYFIFVYWMMSRMGSYYLLGLMVFAPLVTPGAWRKGGIALSRKHRDWLLHRTMSMGLDSRIWAIEATDDVAEICDMTDVPFEPVIIGVEYQPMRLIFSWLGGLALAVALVPGLRQLMVFDAGMAIGGLTVPLSHLVTWLASRCRSKYYRIWPGRMELLRFDAWKSGSSDAVIRSWDLRKSTVVSIGAMVYLASPTERADVDAINALQLSEPREFVYAVTRAALSMHETRSLPNDRLTVE